MGGGGADAPNAYLDLSQAASEAQQEPLVVLGLQRGRNVGRYVVGVALNPSNVRALIVVVSPDAVDEGALLAVVGEHLVGLVLLDLNETLEGGASSPGFDSMFERVDDG